MQGHKEDIAPDEIDFEKTHASGAATPAPPGSEIPDRNFYNIGSFNNIIVP